MLPSVVQRGLEVRTDDIYGGYEVVRLGSIWTRFSSRTNYMVQPHVIVLAVQASTAPRHPGYREVFQDFLVATKYSGFSSGQDGWAHRIGKLSCFVGRFGKSHLSR